LTLKEDLREKLLQISRATIDRLLAPERRRLALKPRARTRPATLLKKQIPIRTFAQWEEDEPGFVEVDLVSHDGGLARGDHAWSLVPLRGLDSDNGAFINHHLLRWCRQRGILFTRCRPYRKNDNCYVEQKNWTVARRYFGYFRYDREEALRVLKELSGLLSLYVNFFQPSVKLKEKRQKGGRVRRVYDEPKTPFERVLEHPRVSEVLKAELQRKYEGLNPADLRRKILRLQQELFRLATPLRGITYE